MSVLTPEYIKGYIAALRTVQKATEECVEYYKNPLPTDDFLDETREQRMIALDEVIMFIEGQRASYRLIVDQLNKEKSNG